MVSAIQLGVDFQQNIRNCAAVVSLLEHSSTFCNLKKMQLVVVFIQKRFRTRNKCQPTFDALSEYAMIYFGHLLYCRICWSAVWYDTKENIDFLLLSDGSELIFNQSRITVANRFDKLWFIRQI